MPYENASPDRRPSTRQIYLICRLLCEEHGIEFPESSRDASTLIGELKAKVAA